VRGNMKENNYIKNILKNISNNFIGQLIVSILAFISSIVFARVMGPQNYGIYSYMIWLMGTLSVVLSLGFPTTITKFLPEYYYNENKLKARKFYFNILKYMSIFLFITVIIMSTSIPWWAKLLKKGTGSDKILILITVVSVIPSVLLSYITNAVQALRAFKLNAKINVISQIALIMINIVIIFTTKSIRLLIISLTVTNLYQIYIYNKLINKRLRSEEEKSKLDLSFDNSRIIKYTKKMYINIIWQQVVWTKSEIFFLGIYSDAKVIGLYNLASGLNAIINSVFNPIMNVLVNHFSELVAKKEKRLLNKIIYKSTKYFAIILIPGFFIIYVLFNDILLLIYSHKYNGVFLVFIILLLPNIVSFVLGVGNSLPFYYEKQNFVINIGIIAGVINIILDLMLIPKQGAIGAAIANTVSQVFFSVLAFVYNIKQFNIKYPIKDMVLITIICCVLFSPFEFIKLSFLIRLICIILVIAIYTVLIIKLKIIDNEDKENFIKVKRKILKLNN
jgi:O-antigen/teichoic acid export membrane protein